MIGSLITKKCTKVLITALASKINGGKAMTPGLSSVVTGQRSQFLLNASAARTFLSLVRERKEVRVICLPHSVKRQCDSHLANGKLGQSNRG